MHLLIRWKRICGGPKGDDGLEDWHLVECCWWEYERVKGLVSSGSEAILLLLVAPPQWKDTGEKDRRKDMQPPWPVEDPASASPAPAPAPLLVQRLEGLVSCYWAQVWLLPTGQRKWSRTQQDNFCLLQTCWTQPNMSSGCGKCGRRLRCGAFISCADQKGKFRSVSSHF